MKDRLVIKILGLLLFCSMAAAQQVPPATIGVSSAGATISDFKGKVSLQLPGQSLMSPSRGQVLPPETTVNTDDGRLLLRLSDGSEVLVRPHTRVVIKEPETSAWRYLQLLMGRIRTQIQKRLGGTPAFQIGTPSAVISVRGTRFDVEVNHRGFTEVDVEEGVVELESLNGHGQSVLITAGFSSRVGMDSGPEVPRPTHDLRPLLDRPGHSGKRESRDDDAIRRLEGSDHESGPSGSDGGSLSGSDGESSGSSGGSSDSDSSTQSSSDGGSLSGSDGSSRTSGSGDRSGTSGSPDSGSGDHHGGRPPNLI